VPQILATPKQGRTQSSRGLELDDLIHIDLDGAWDAAALDAAVGGIRTLDYRDSGPKLRYFCTRGAIDELDRQLPRPPPRFIVYGSGDFHHLSGLWVRRAAASLQNGSHLMLVSFDNHPDWDVRPPRWGCGGWINRALELPGVEKAHVWGCGNFEPAWPARLFANHAALKSGRLVIHPWAERQKPQVQRRFVCMTRDDWRRQFETFATSVANTNVYVTVDLDCLAADQAVTNWESGLFTAEDIAWAIRQLRSNANLIAADICGAYSPTLARGVFRRLAIWWDHPKLPPTSLFAARQVNNAALRIILPALEASAQGR